MVMTSSETLVGESAVGAAKAARRWLVEASPEGERTLGPGSYLVEADLARPASAKAAKAALKAMGWPDPDADIPMTIVDESPRVAASTHLRFVGRLERPMVLVDNEAVAWTYVRRLVSDPFADLVDDLLAFKLFPGETTEARFMSRLGSRDMRGGALAREVTEQLLRDMGFHVFRLTALRENMRLPDRPGAGMTLWLGIVRWDRAKESVITIRDPLFFEDMVPVEGT